MLPKKWINVLTSGTLIVIAIAFALLLAEMALRIVAPQWSDQWKMYRVDPVYGRGLQNGVHDAIVHGHSGEFKFNFSTNSVGLRMNWVPTRPKPLATKRVLLIGDSFTFGYGVQQNETYAEHLQRILDPQRAKIEIINAGFAGGFTLDTEYVYMKNSGINWKPDIVVVGICLSNDLVDSGTIIWNVSDGAIVSVKKNNDWIPAWVKRCGLPNLLTKHTIPQLIDRWRTLISADSNYLHPFQSVAVAANIQGQQQSRTPHIDVVQSVCDFHPQMPATYAGNSELHIKPPPLPSDSKNWLPEQKVAWLSSAWAYHSKIHGYDLMFLFIPDATEVQWPTSEEQLEMRSGIRSVFKKAASNAGIEIIDPVRDMRDYIPERPQ